MQQGTDIDQGQQGDLARRATLLARRIGSTSRQEIAVEVDQIRRVAIRLGMLPAAGIAQALESALARGDSGPLVTGWIAILAEAIGGDRHDAQAFDSYAALCSVRLAG